MMQLLPAYLFSTRRWKTLICSCMTALRVQEERIATDGGWALAACRRTHCCCWLR